MIRRFLVRLSFSGLIKGSEPPLTTSQEPEMIRLSKLVSQQSVCSRREAERLINLGLVRINGERIYSNASVPKQHNLKVFTPKGVRKEIPVIRLWVMNKPR